MVMNKINFLDIKKILIVRLGKIGDIITTSFVFEIFKINYPFIELHLLTLSSNREVLQYNPKVDKIFYTKKNILLYYELLKIRKNNYDLVIDLNDNPSTTTANIFRLVKAIYKAGYDFQKYQKLLDIKIKPLEKKNYHVIEQIQNFIKELGLTIDNNLVKPTFYIGCEELNDVKNELNEIKKKYKVVAINISAGAPIRYWTVSQWIDLLRNINANFPQMKYLLLSTNKDEHLRQKIKSNFNNNLFINSDYNSIQHFAAYIKRADILITPDTSAVHIASALGTPVVALFPNYEWNFISWQPYKVPHRSIKSPTENVKKISVKKVFENFLELKNELKIN